MTPAELKILCLPQVQERIVEAMGKWQAGDPYLIPPFDGTEYVCDYCDVAEDGEWKPYLKSSAIIRIPLAIDTEKPERGLWGMVDWKRWCALVLEDRFEIHDNAFHFESATPYHALLLALCAQWGIAADWMEGR